MRTKRTYEAQISGAPGCIFFILFLAAIGFIDVIGWLVNLIF